MAADEYSIGGSLSGESSCYDGYNFQDTVAVGCTLTLVEKAAMKGSDEEESDDEEYTDSEFYSSSEVKFLL